ncbi:MAG: hypothetical protein AB7O91_04900 [Sphingomonas sp.]
MKHRALAASLLLLGAGAARAQTPPAQPAPRPPACATPEHRQFDFWIGYWDVYPANSERMIAHSLIERRYAGCAIRENWLPLGREGGGSFSGWRSGERRWRQTWVDSGGAWVEFQGGMQGDAMVLTGEWAGVNGPGTTALVRMTYTRQEGGVVRQLGEASTDGGATWGPAWDYYYRPSASPPPASPGGSPQS